MGDKFWLPTTRIRIYIDTTGNSKSHMESFMGYHKKRQLIIKIFRHKMVHIAQPQHISLRNGKKVAWRYVHENTSDHLILRGELTWNRIMYMAVCQKDKLMTEDFTEGRDWEAYSLL